MKWIEPSKLKWIGLFILPALYLLPPIHTFVNNISMILLAADFQMLKQYILSFGVLAPAISILLMMFQALLAPLPSLVLVLANAWVFGWLWGAFYSWFGGMLGSVLCFYIARGYGRPAVEKLFGKEKIDRIDVFFRAYGQYAVLVARMTPLFSFDLISYVAGLTAIDLRSFLWATAIGQLPAVILYSLLGENLANGMLHLLWAFPILFLLVILGMGVRNWFQRQSEFK